MTTFKTAVASFLKAEDSWLSDADLPAIAALEAAAVELDKAVTPALLSAYGLTYRNLLKRKPAEAPEVTDPLEELIQGLESPSA